MGEPSPPAENPLPLQQGQPLRMGIFEPNGSNSKRLKSACQEDIVLFGKKTKPVVQNVEKSTGPPAGVLLWKMKR